MEFEEFKKWAGQYNAVPVSRRLLADVWTPVSVFLSIRRGASYPFLLESVEGGEQVARYSFIGRDPYQVLLFDGRKVVLRTNDKERELQKPYFEALDELTEQYRQPELLDLPRLTGGAVGYSSYDTIREIEQLTGGPEKDLDTPEAIWAFYDEVIAFDHVKHQLVLMKTVFPENYSSPEKAYNDAQQALDRMETTVRSTPEPDRPIDLDKELLGSNQSRSEFVKNVEKAKSYIVEGEIFQVVLSQRFKVPFRGDRFMLYRALRMVNPSPYLFYLDFKEFSLIGSSPEVLVRVTGREARLLPIAGTRPRGVDRDEDLVLEKELLADPKEVAEHIMLVDLGRNDLSRVCNAGSVKLERNRVIERYSHVMHIVSDVVGKLRDGENAVSALKACFPAGTVSGAPKIRAMEIIDRLEPVRRGPYAGAVGYFDYSGNMDTCIAIRTMVATSENVYIQAGAGIVADSRPGNEFEETKNKARALVEALDLALTITQNEKHPKKPTTE